MSHELLRINSGLVTEQTLLGELNPPQFTSARLVGIVFYLVPYPPGSAFFIAGASELLEVQGLV